ncbi:MAG: hypothetical protein IJ733_18965, partial [Lachnospiraceae bacterium]|nr:hypothetical protein [Lachnospiraceae bacterium]
MGELGENFGDKHDDTVYFISAYKPEIAGQNVEKLQKLIYFFAILYFLFLIFAYVVIKSFELHASYFLVPLFLVAAWKVTDLFRRKPEGVPFGVVRGFAFAFFLVLAVLVAYIDGITYPDAPTILMPVFFLSVAAFYVDFFA